MDVGRPGASQTAGNQRFFLKDTKRFLDWMVVMVLCVNLHRMGPLTTQSIHTDCQMLRQEWRVR
jgi:hypothetical protein